MDCASRSRCLGIIPCGHTVSPKSFTEWYGWNSIQIASQAAPKPWTAAMTMMAIAISSLKVNGSMTTPQLKKIYLSLVIFHLSVGHFQGTCDYSNDQLINGK
jgi:hypothetical protein